MSDWRELAQELDRWSDAGETATLWWRDDDASDATPWLDRLLLHAERTPIALAVIPGLATRDLADRLLAHDEVSILQHGWRHVTHVPGGQSEYPSSRSPADVSTELIRGRHVLDELFGDRAIRMFAPPWHGLDEAFLPLLPRSGLTALSIKGPRRDAWPCEGLYGVNAHVSAIRWSDPPSFGEDEAIYVAQFVGHLRRRRLRVCDPAEPTGLLTHHLVQDDASYAFIRRLIEATSLHGAAEWIDIRSILPPAPRGERPHG